MHKPLFFHVRGDRTVTFCVGLDDYSRMVIGHSVVHKNDNFSKKKGREVSFGRMKFALENKSTHLENKENQRVHPVVSKSMPDIIKRSKEIFKIDETIVKYIARQKNDNKSMVIQKAF